MTEFTTSVAAFNNPDNPGECVRLVFINSRPGLTLQDAQIFENPVVTTIVADLAMSTRLARDLRNLLTKLLGEAEMSPEEAEKLKAFLDGASEPSGTLADAAAKAKGEAK